MLTTLRRLRRFAAPTPAAPSTAPIPLDRLLPVAAGLVSEDGENPEYDRALAEMTCALAGLSSDCKDDVAAVIRDHADRA